MGLSQSLGPRDSDLELGAWSPPCYSSLSLTTPLHPTPFIVHSFHWTRNSRFFNIAKDPRVSMRRRSGTLVIDFRSGGRPEEYEGEYQCFARNKFGTALSNRIRLQVSSECMGQAQDALLLAQWRAGHGGSFQTGCPTLVLQVPRCPEIGRAHV